MRPLAQRASAAAKGSKGASVPREEEAAERLLRGAGRAEWERRGGGRGRRGLWSGDPREARGGGDGSLGMPGRCSQENGTAEEAGGGDAGAENGRERVRAEMREEEPESSLDPSSVGLEEGGGASSIGRSRGTDEAWPCDRYRTFLLGSAVCYL